MIKLLIIPLTFLLISPAIFIRICAQVQSGTTENTLRILDINVWSGLDYKGYIKMGEYEAPSEREKRYQALIRQIKRLNPDLIGIHEANPLPEYAKRLSKDTEYEVFYHLAVGGVRLGPIGLPWNLREGDAILAKKSLRPRFVGRQQLSGGYVGKWASFHFTDATQIIAIQITLRNIPVYIFATHWHASLPDLPYILERADGLYRLNQMTYAEYQKIRSKIMEGADWRVSESKKTIKFIRETAKDNIFILMGDFNSESYSREISELTASGMIDVYKHANPDSSGYTWDPRTNMNIQKYYMNESFTDKDLDSYSKLEKFHTETPKRIDYIFIGPSSMYGINAVSIHSCEVVMKELIQGIQTSDHYGVIAEIHINR